MILTGNNKTTADKLIEHFKTGGQEEQLSKKLLEQWKIVATLHGLLFQHQSPAVALPLLRAIFKPMSIATSYNYLTLTKQVIASLHVSNQEYARIVADEWIIKDREVAKALGDARAMTMATANYIKVHQLDKSSSDELDRSKIQQHFNAIVFMGGAGEMPKQIGFNEFDKLPAEQKSKVIEFIEATMDVQDAEEVLNAGKDE